MAAAWVWGAPLFAFALLVAAIATGMGTIFALVCGVALIAAVMAAVHHAEVVAHRLGEPLGTLVLALSVTVIEASLILSLMFAAGGSDPALARDTLYAAVMIICNGVVGICILLGGLAHHEQSFRVEGAGAALAALMVLSVLTLVLPGFTTSTPGGTFSVPQMGFVALASAVLWLVFVFIQTIRHRDYFLPETNKADEETHAAPPSVRAAWASFALLVVSLVSVVGLAKVLSPPLERAVAAVGAPEASLGILIAMVVLLPETWAAIRAARANRLQTSMNLALGSAIASIGLTVPVVVVAAAVTGIPLVLGLAAKEMSLLVLTLLVVTVTLGTGRTHIMQGAVHLVIFAAFVFFTFAG